MCGLLAVLSAAAPAAGQHGGPTPVRVAAVETRSMAPTIELVGTVLPSRRSLLGSEVDGLVVELPVSEGQTVARGDLICRLSAGVREYELQQAQAELQRLRAVLAELEAGERQEDLDRLKAAAEEAKATLARWEFEKKRVTDLRERGECTAKEFSDVMSTYDAGAQRVTMTEAEYRKAVAGPRREQIAAARHAADAQQAAVARLEYEVRRTAIRAPFDGAIATKRTEQGQWLAEGQAVVEMLELDPVRIRVNVPEHLVRHNPPATSVSAYVEALGRTVEGAVAQVVPDADPQARTFPTDLLIRNPDGALKPGMFVRAQMRAGPAAERLAVPKDAVLRSPAGTTVWAVRKTEQGYMAAPSPVQLGPEWRDWISITAPDLKPGDWVAVRGNESLMAPGPVIPTPIADTPAVPTAGSPQPPPAAAPGDKS